MSPTLLELVVALLLIVAAWRIAKWIAPEIMAAMAAFWRGANPPEERGPWPPEKNITPPAASKPDAPSKHGFRQ